MKNNKTLVCFLGFLETNEMWSFLESEDLNLIKYEIPGHNSQGEIVEPYSIAEFAQKCWREIQEKYGNEIDLIGHSMGGYIALEIAKSKEFKGKLILLNSTYWEDSEEKKKDRFRIVDLVESKKNVFISETIPKLFLDPEDFKNDVQCLISAAKQFDKTAIQNASIAMANRSNNLEVIENLGDRCAFILGDKDEIIPLSKVMEKEAMYPKAKMFVMENSGHMSYLEKTQDCRLVIFDILRD